jgi:flagellar biosynthesis protein FliR
MAISFEQWLALLQHYLLPFFRISGLLMVMPILGARAVPARIRLMLAMTLTALVAPLLDPPALSVTTFIALAAIAAEIVLGLSMGFVFLVVFQCFVLSGQFIAIKLGLAFASLNDPVNGVQTTVISQFYLVAISLLFLSLHGHITLIEWLIVSFDKVPLGQFVAESYFPIAHLGGWLFSWALRLSLSLMTALLLVNVAFGVMSRSAPQLNIFSVGFPFTLGFGLLLMYLGLEGALLLFEEVAGEGFLFIKNTLINH